MPKKRKIDSKTSPKKRQRLEVPKLFSSKTSFNELSSSELEEGELPESPHVACASQTKIPWNFQKNADQIHNKGKKKNKGSKHYKTSNFSKNDRPSSSKIGSIFLRLKEKVGYQSKGNSSRHVLEDGPRLLVAVGSPTSESSKLTPNRSSSLPKSKIEESLRTDISRRVLGKIEEMETKSSFRVALGQFFGVIRTDSGLKGLVEEAVSALSKKPLNENPLLVVNKETETNRRNVLFSSFELNTDIMDMDLSSDNSSDSLLEYLLNRTDSADVETTFVPKVCEASFGGTLVSNSVGEFPVTSTINVRTNDERGVLVEETPSPFSRNDHSNNSCSYTAVETSTEDKILCDRSRSSSSKAHENMLQVKSDFSKIKSFCSKMPGMELDDFPNSHHDFKSIEISEDVATFNLINPSEHVSLMNPRKEEKSFSPIVMSVCNSKPDSSAISAHEPEYNGAKPTEDAIVKTSESIPTITTLSLNYYVENSDFLDTNSGVENVRDDGSDTSSRSSDRFLDALHIDDKSEGHTSPLPVLSKSVSARGDYNNCGSSDLPDRSSDTICTDVTVRLHRISASVMNALHLGVIDCKKLDMTNGLLTMKTIPQPVLSSTDENCPEKNEIENPVPIDSNVNATSQTHTVITKPTSSAENKPKVTMNVSVTLKRLSLDVIKKFTHPKTKTRDEQKGNLLKDETENTSQNFDRHADETLVNQGQNSLPTENKISDSETSTPIKSLIASVSIAKPPASDSIVSTSDKKKQSLNIISEPKNVAPMKVPLSCLGVSKKNSTSSCEPSTSSSNLNINQSRTNVLVGNKSNNASQTRPPTNSKNSEILCSPVKGVAPDRNKTLPSTISSNDKSPFSNIQKPGTNVKALECKKPVLSNKLNKANTPNKSVSRTTADVSGIAKTHNVKTSSERRIENTINPTKLFVTSSPAKNPESFKNFKIPKVSTSQKVTASKTPPSSTTSTPVLKTSLTDHRKIGEKPASTSCLLDPKPISGNTNHSMVKSKSDINLQKPDCSKKCAKSSTDNEKPSTVVKDVSSDNPSTSTVTKDISPNSPPSVKETSTNKVSSNFEFISTDPAENADNFNPRWSELKNVTTDAERYKKIRERWRNLTIPDPNQELTYIHRRIQCLPPTTNKKFQRNVPRHLRSQSCTALYEDLIREEECKKIEQLQLLEIQQRRDVASTVGNVSFIPAHRLDEELQYLEGQYAFRRNDIINNAQRTIRRYRDYMNEVRTFQKFYQDLNNKDDKTLLTPRQAQLLDDTERMYREFRRFYR